MLFYVFWLQVLSNILITSNLSKSTEVALLYFGKCWKKIYFTNGFLINLVFLSNSGVISCVVIKGSYNIITSYNIIIMITFTNSSLKIMHFCWIRVISCILSKTFLNVFITSDLSKLMAVALLYSLENWKRITFTNCVLKILLFLLNSCFFMNFA